MTEFYLDFETSGLDPTRDKIISIQFQPLDTASGAPRGDLAILKEWESSEKDILSSFLEHMKPQQMWGFVPVGYNLRFELFFLQVRTKKTLGLELDSKWLYYDLPRLDIKSTLVMMNHGEFKGATLDWLIRKPIDNSLVPKLYLERKYSDIEAYIREEAQRFLHAYQFLKTKLPQVKREYVPMP